MKRLNLGLLSALVLALFLGFTSVNGFAQAFTVVQTMNPPPPNAVAPGANVQVTVNITCNQALAGVAFAANLPAGFDVTAANQNSNPGSNFNDGTNEWLFLINCAQAQLLVINYTTQVPLAQPNGVVNVVGTAQAAGNIIVNATNHITINVQQGAPPPPPGGDVNGATLNRDLPNDGQIGEVVKVVLNMVVPQNAGDPVPANEFGFAAPEIDNVSAVAIIEDLPNGAQFVQWTKTNTCTPMSQQTAQANGGDIGLICGTKVFNVGNNVQPFEYEVMLPGNPGGANWAGFISGQFFNNDPAAGFNNQTGGDTQLNVQNANLCQQYDNTGFGAFKDNNRLDLGTTFPAPGRELQRALSNFINNTPAPAGQVPTLAQIQELIAFFKDLTPCDQFAAAVAAFARRAAQPNHILDVLAGLLQTKAATVDLTASSLRVAPGERFTLTMTLRASQELAGLALSGLLPEGWTATLMTDSNAYVKASESLALWVDTAEGQTRTVTYEVTVPTSAQAGGYTLAAEASAGLPRFFAERRSVQLEVAGAAILRFEGLSLKATAGSATFVAQGSGIQSLQVQIYNLAGGLVFDETNNGSSLRFSGLSSEGQALANGVYLAVVTVRGFNSEVARTQVRKFVLLR